MPVAPDLVACKEYLGEDSSYSDEQVEAARAAELIAQINRCKIPADPDPENPLPYPADLAEALKRRVQRNLSMRNKALGIQVNEGFIQRIGSTDPEVRRLEGPYRRLVVG